MVRSPLELRIGSLRGRVRRLLALHGLSYLVAALILASVGFGAADWLIHLAPEVRVAALVGLIMLGVWLAARLVVAPLLVRFRDLDVALRIERRWPGLDDRLASTIQFLRQTGDEHGSAALREATIRQTLNETDSIDFRQAVDVAPIKRALGLAGSTIVGLGLLAAVAPITFQIAAARLFNPYGPTRWPRATHLSIVEAPSKVARGDSFGLVAAVAQGERAPASARVTYRYADGTTTTEALRPVEGGSYRGRIEATDRSFEFAVAAGDDRTAWRKVQVVPPPELESTTIRLVAPAYTALPTATLAPGNTQVRAVEGTRVEVTARASKRLASATLTRGEKQAKSPATLDPSGRQIGASFTVADSGPFWFELRDDEGFRNRAVVRYDVRALKDEAPRVVIEEPTADRDVPAGATVPVQIALDDDYGLQSARLLYAIAAAGSEPTREAVTPLWDAPPPAEAKPPLRQEVLHAWDLGPLALVPGSIVSYHADARDYDANDGPNLGKSRTLRLRVISPEELARQIEDRRRDLREEVDRALKMQEQAAKPVREAGETLRQVEKLDPKDRAELRNAEMIQKQVAAKVAGQSDSLDQKVRGLLDDIRDFKMDDADAKRQLEAIRDGVERIRDRHLAPADQGLAQAGKALDGDEAPPAGEPKPGPGQPQPEKPPAAAVSPSGDSKPNPKPDPLGKPAGDPAKPAQPPAAGDAPKPPGPGGADDKPAGEPAKAGQPAKARAREALAQAEGNQKAIADELAKMRDGLGEFETFRGLVRDAQDVLKAQEQALKESAEAAAKDDMMSKGRDQLSPEQKANLDKLGERQQEIARDLQGLQEKMKGMAGKLEASDPLAASALKGAAEESQAKGTAGKMGEAADQIEKNQLGAARQGQEQARDQVKELVDAVQNRGNRELSRLVKELKDSEKAMKELRQRQAENLKKTQQAKGNPDAKQRADELKKLAKEQGQIQQEAKKQLQKLQKLRADAAAQAGSKAAAKMAKAEQDLDDDQGEQAEQDQAEALADLEDAQEQIEEARKDAEEELAAEQLAKMGDALKSLAERQAKVVAEIVDYEAIRAGAQGRLTTAQRGGVRDLGRVEAGLKDETGEMVEKLEGAPVFALTLKRAAEAMDQSARRLQTIKTDDEARRPAKAAADRIAQLIDALKPDPSKPGGSGGGGGGGGGGGSPGDGIPPAAQVKMLKSLQLEINDRTEYYDELKGRDKPLTPNQVTEVARLKVDQGTLADLARDLTRPKKSDGED